MIRKSPPILDIFGVKRCTKCGEIKSNSEFRPETGGTGVLGTRAACIKCENKYNAAHIKERYKADPKFREQQRVRNRINFKKHKERYYASMSRWREENKDKVRGYLRKYGKKYREKKMKEETCEIIRNHAEEMKDDPERLSTEFIKKIIRVKCDD